MKRLLPVLTCATIAASLTGCFGPPPAKSGGGAAGTSGQLTSSSQEEPPSQAGKYGGTLTTSVISDPKTFNYWVAAETSSTGAVSPIYDSLNQLNAYTLKYEGQLAELPQISEDGLTYTYRLKDGLTWSDGHPLTADDVIFTLDVVFDPKTETIMRESMMVDYQGADGSIKREAFKYRKVDDRTVEFKLPVRYAPANDIFNFPIAPKHKLENAYRSGQFNSTWGVNTPVSQLVSSGAWILKEYVPGQRLVYSRNPHYWRKGVNGQPLPYLDQYVQLIVPDLNTTTLKFRSGDTDVVVVQAPDYSSLKKEEAAGGYELINTGPGWGFNYLGFNLNPNSKVDKNLVQLFSDVRFRQAMSHIVNRERMANDLFLGLAQPLYGPVSPANKLFYNPDIPKFPYDLEKARALLAEIGLKNTDGNKWLEYNGKEVRFNILTNTENNLRKNMATIIQNDLRSVGLNVQFTPISFNDLVRRLDSAPYDWEACILGFTGGPEPHNGSNIWRSSGPSHQWWPKQKKPATEWEAEIDKLWIEGAQELDPEKRRAIYNRWQTIVAEQQPFNFTIVADGLVAVRKRFGNLKPCSLGLVTWNIEELYDLQATREQP